MAKVSMTIADFDGVMYNVQNPEEENPNVITVSLKHSSFHQFEDHGATVSQSAVCTAALRRTSVLHGVSTADCSARALAGCIAPRQKSEYAAS